MVTACTVPGLFESLALFHGAHPGVAVTLAEDESAALIERVRSGTADLALIGAAGAPPPGLESLTVASERLTAAAAPGHPLLAGRGEVTLADLAGYPVVCLPVGTGIRATLDAACAAAGVRLDVALEASAPGTVADLAARGLGVAVLSESMTAAHSARLRAVPVSDAALPAVLALVWKPEPGPAAREFLRCCRQAFPAAAGLPARPATAGLLPPGTAAGRARLPPAAVVGEHHAPVPDAGIGRNGGGWPRTRPAATGRVRAILAARSARALARWERRPAGVTAGGVCTVSQMPAMSTHSIVPSRQNQAIGGTSATTPTANSTQPIAAGNIRPATMARPPRMPNRTMPSASGRKKSFCSRFSVCAEAAVR